MSRREEVRRVTAELAARLEELEAVVEALTLGLSGDPERDEREEQGEGEAVEPGQ